MLTTPEKNRLARRFLGAVAQIVHPAPEQMEQLTFAVAKILNVEAKDIEDGAKLNFLMQQTASTAQAAVLTQNMVAVLLGFARGQEIEVPDELLNAVGLKRKSASGLVLPGR